MKERRKFQRFPLALNASFVAGNDKETPCKIVNISREGTGLKVYERRGMNMPSNMRLDIYVPSKRSPVSALVTLTWIKKINKNNEFGCLAGCLFNRIKNEEKWQLLDQAYDNWRANMKKH